MTIKELRDLQREHEKKATEIFNSISFNNWTDEKRTEWLEHGRKAREYKELANEMEIKASKENNKKTFVNGYGEATTREITSTTYNASCNRLKKQVENFLK